MYPRDAGSSATPTPVTSVPDGGFATGIYEIRVNPNPGFTLTGTDTGQTYIASQRTEVVSGTIVNGITLSAATTLVTLTNAQIAAAFTTASAGYQAGGVSFSNSVNTLLVNLYSGVVSGVNTDNLDFELVAVAGANYTEIPAGTFNFSGGTYALRIFPKDVTNQTLQHTTPGQDYLQSATFSLGNPTDITGLEVNTTNPINAPTITLLSSAFSTLSTTVE